MQYQLPPAPAAAPAPAPRQMAEELHSILGTLKRGWRYVAASAAVCLTLGIIYASRGKVTYQASAGLLVLNQGGRALPGPGGDPFQSMRGGEDSLSTHIMIIRSPIIIERALELAGLKALSVDSVVERLTITLPQETAKVLRIGYVAGTRDEATRVMGGVISSYENFLKNNYQKNTGDTIKLFMKARDELSGDLARMEREYLEYRQNNPSYNVDESGRSFSSRRLDQWDQEANRAMVRALQLQSQLELGRRLIGEGVDPANVAAALNRLGVAGNDAGVVPGQSEGAAATGRSYEQLEVQLDDIGFRRLTAARLLDYLRSERDGAESSTKANPRDVADVFEADPETLRLRSDILEATAKAENARRVARNANDPAVAGVRSRVRELEGKLRAHWQRRKPRIEAELTRSNVDEAVRGAEAELWTLTAKETALKETLALVKADRLLKGRRARARLASLHGPQDSRVLELDRQIARLEEKPADETGPQSGAGGASLLGTLEQNLAAVEVMRERIQQQFQKHMAESKKAEVGMLAETNLRNNLERQRVLFNSVVDQLKQAQIVSDFGSVTAQTINPPSIREVRPRTASVVFGGLFLGIAAGAGLAFLADKLDSRIRTLSEMRHALDIGVLGMIPELNREQRDRSAEIGLICHTEPRSIVSESYKSIRTNVEHLCRSRDAKVLLVTSPRPADGKSTMASNLAISLAHAGRSVLLVDADMRRPTQHLTFGLGKDRGLPDLLKETLPLQRVVLPTQVENLYVLPAGSMVSNPAELLASRLLLTTISDMRGKYDMVIIDSPPLLAVADPSIIGAAVDGIIMVVRATTTCRPDLERALEVLRTLETPLLGAVINGITPDLARSRYGHGYGYGYGSYDEPGPVGVNANAPGVARAEITNGVAPR